MPSAMPVRWLDPFGPIQRIFFANDSLPTTICLVQHGGQNHLIDTGLPGGEDALVERLRERDIRIDHVYLTHHHATHTAGVGALRAYCQPRVYCHATERTFCEETGVSIDEIFTDQDTVGGFLQVLHAPGHTPGNVAFIWSDGRALFAGDVVMGLGPSDDDPLSLPPAWDEASQPQILRDIQNAERLDFDVLLPAHGRQFATGGHEVLAAFAGKIGRAASA